MFWAKLVNSRRFQANSSKSIIILFLHLRLSLQSGPLCPGCLAKLAVCRVMCLKIHQNIQKNSIYQLMYFNKNTFSVSCKYNHVTLIQKELSFLWFCAGLAQSVVTELRHGRRRARPQISFGEWENSSHQSYQRGCTEVTFPRGWNGFVVKIVTRLSLMYRLRDGGVITSSYPASSWCGT